MAIPGHPLREWELAATTAGLLELVSELAIF
jgi:hypothetical protein